jgi:hypothetical protein
LPLLECCNFPIRFHDNADGGPRMLMVLLLTRDQ